MPTNLIIMSVQDKNSEMYIHEKIEKILKSMPTDFNLAVDYICDSFFNDLNTLRGLTSVSQSVKNHDLFIEYYFFTQAYLESKKFDSMVNPKLSSNKKANMDNIATYFQNLRGVIKKRLDEDLLVRTENKYKVLFDNVFSYTFTDGDLKRIQQLVNELRDNIVTSGLFTGEHKDRILKRLEKFQRELHKKVSNLDSFWALIGDAGIILGKFGKDAKPFVDRIREILEIGWRTQAKAEELPSGTEFPLLKGKIDDIIT